MSTAVEFKEKAAVAWAAGLYDEAIESYTAAIYQAANAEDKEMLKTLHSNRSAAYMKVSRTQAALTDAIKCTEIDETWPKGYSRKGDALYSLGKFTEAYNAYNAGLRHAKADVTLTEKAELAMTAIRMASPPDAPGQEGGAWASRGSVPASAPASSTILTVQGLLKAMVVVNGIIFAIPFLNGLAAINYKMFVLGAFSDFALALYAGHGFPKFSMEYAQRVLPDPSTMYLLMCIILLIGTPYFTAMIPIFLLETAQLAYFVAQRSAEKHAAVLDKASVYVDKFVPSWFNIVGWEAMTTSTKWSQFNQKVMEFCCLFEVSQGLMMLFQLLFPTRNFLMTMMWWQYLQMRYMMDTSGNIKRAFWAIDSRISNLLAYHFVPSVVRTGYGKMRDFLSKQVQMPTADGAGSAGSGLTGMLSKCTIS